MYAAWDRLQSHMQNFSRFLALELAYIKRYLSLRIQWWLQSRNRRSWLFSRLVCVYFPSSRGTPKFTNVREECLASLGGAISDVPHTARVIIGGDLNCFPHPSARDVFSSQVSRSLSNAGLSLVGYNLPNFSSFVTFVAGNGTSRSFIDHFLSHLTSFLQRQVSLL